MRSISACARWETFAVRSARASVRLPTSKATNALRTPISSSTSPTITSMSPRPPSSEIKPRERAVLLLVARKEAIGQRDVVGIGGGECSGGPYDHRDLEVFRGGWCEDWRCQFVALKAFDDGRAPRPARRRRGWGSRHLALAGAAQVALIQHVQRPCFGHYVARSDIRGDEGHIHTLAQLAGDLIDPGLRVRDGVGPLLIGRRRLHEGLEHRQRETDNDRQEQHRD